MGLEMVELVMRAEEEFGIEIKDEDCSFVSTCGQLCNLIQYQMGIGGVNEGCPSQRAFYHVRRELVGLTGKTRREITPRTSLHNLIPAQNRAQHWDELGKKLDLSLPDLVRPDNITTPLNWWVILSVLLVLASWPLHIPWGFALGSCISCYLVFQLTRPLAVALPIETRNVGDIARRYAPRYNTMSPIEPTRDIWPQVQKLISDELSIPIEKVTRDADFFRDLGAG